jgi:3-methyladenine DNA glycosylase AlkD
MVERAVQELVKELKSKGNSAEADTVSKYLKTSSLQFFGNRLPVIRQTAKEYSKQVPEVFFTEFLQKLWRFRVFDVRRAATEAMLQFLKRGMPEQEALPLIDVWLEDIDTWALTDPLGWCLSKLLITNPELKETLKEWGNSDNIWRRRMSILPYVDLCLKGQYSKEYAAWILEAITPHISDKEFYIQRAVGWALRQLSYHEPELVRSFIEQHKSQMTRLVIREGSRKL